MFARRPLLRRFIALLAMAAVMLGAFEHEDLILQEVREAPSRELAAEATASLSEFTLDEQAAESGTEGTFRAEKHRLWLSPKNETGRVTRFSTGELTGLSARKIAAPGLGLRRRLAGVVALRL